MALLPQPPPIRERPRGRAAPLSVFFTSSAPAVLLRMALRLAPRVAGVPASFALFEGMAPLKAGEPSVVAVGGDPLASGFDGQGGEVSVRDKVALCVCFSTQASEDCPMTLAGLYPHAVLAVPNCGEESEAGREGRGLTKDARVGDDAKESAQHEIGEGIRPIAGQHRLEPSTIARMFLRIGPVRVNQHVDVKEYHAKRP